MSEPRPISLSDEQLTAIMNAAFPLPPYEREAFLIAVAMMFQGRAEIGDGELGRAIRELQREHFTPPAPEHPPQQLKKVAAR